MSLRAMASAMRAAMAARVEASNTARTGSSTARRSRTRASSWVARREWPPRAKKSSSRPTAVDAEQVGPDGGQGLLDRAVGVGAARLRGPVGAGRAARSSLPVGVSGMRGSVTNAAGTMKSGSAAATERRSSLVDGESERGAPAVARHDVGDQLRVARRAASLGAGAGDDHDLAHGGVAGQSSLDLAELDAEAAHLDLSVGAPGPLDLAVGAVAAEVAGQVQPVVGAARERAGHELARGGVGVAEVAAGQVGAAHADLAQLADAGQAAALRQHQQLDVAHAASQRQGLESAGAGHDLVVADRALGLGRAVEVDRLDGGGDAAHAIDVARGSARRRPRRRGAGWRSGPARRRAARPGAGPWPGSGGRR